MKLLIVGGVAGGASAAARARRLSEDAEIVLFERGPDVSFANCGLPYYVGGEIAERDKLLVTTPERLRSRFKLDVRTRSSVEAIDRTAKKVRVRDLASGREYEESYDKLILAPGAAPLRPPIPGIDLPGIFTLRNLQDMDRIKERVDQGVKQAVRRGRRVHRPGTGRELRPTWHRDHGGRVAGPGSAAVRQGDDHAHRSRSWRAKASRCCSASLPKRSSRPPMAWSCGLKSGQRLACSTGHPRRRRAPGEQAGGRCGPGSRASWRHPGQRTPSDQRPGHLCSRRRHRGQGLRDRRPDASAAGRTRQPPGPDRRRQHLRPCRPTYRGTQGTAIVGVFDRTAAMTGASEKALRRANRPFRKVYVHPTHHAGYYPGAEAMTLKLLFDPKTGKVLGAQAVGGAGVDKRIDVLAVAIQAGMTVFDLEEMELAYAPQYGSAKDPINMAGFVAGGLLRGDHPQVDVEAVLAAPAAERPFLLDVRTPQEFAAGHIPGAVNIPVDDLRSRLGELPRDRKIAAYCQVGQRGYLATRILLQAGFPAVNIGGGYKTYKLFQPSA